jgi:hypothetical protein
MSVASMMFRIIKRPCLLEVMQSASKFSHCQIGRAYDSVGDTL